MYNSKFILKNGKDIYPGYLDKEQRNNLRIKFGSDREYMWCGCKPDDKLFYRISEDCKIYPEHNNYVHDKNCCRYKDNIGKPERQTAYVINEEDGEVTAYLSFDPKSFSLADEMELNKEQNNTVPDELENGSIEEVVIEKDKDQEKLDPQKEPQMNLAELIRSINVDAFTEKILNNRNIDSKGTFSKYVYYRMKKIRIGKMKRSLGDLTLVKDGVQFFYLPLSKIEKNEINGVKKYYIKTIAPNGSIYSNFVFPKTLEKAIKQFKKTYGMEQPDENTMVAGFQYLKKSRNKSSYRVFGRIHFFQISNIGIYCRNLNEKSGIDQLTDICNQNKDIRFWIPPEEENIGGIVEVNEKIKKILVLFRSQKNETITFDKKIYVPFVVEKEAIITPAILRSLTDMG